MTTCSHYTLTIPCAYVAQRFALAETNLESSVERCGTGVSPFEARLECPSVILLQPTTNSIRSLRSGVQNLAPFECARFLLAEEHIPCTRVWQQIEPGIKPHTPAE